MIIVDVIVFMILMTYYYVNYTNANTRTNNTYYCYYCYYCCLLPGDQPRSAHAELSLSLRVDTILNVMLLMLCSGII